MYIYFNVYPPISNGDVDSDVGSAPDTPPRIRHPDGTYEVLSVDNESVEDGDDSLSYDAVKEYVEIELLQGVSWESLSTQDFCFVLDFVFVLL